MVPLSRWLLAAALLAAAVVALRLGVAEWYFQRETVEGFRQAVAWNAAHPEYPATLARALEVTLAESEPGEVRRLLETATRLGPHRAEHWTQLATACELEGDRAAAEAAYQAASRLYPNAPEIHWKLANFLVRTGRNEEAFAAFRRALAGDRKLLRPVMHIAWRVTEDGERILRELAPPEPDYLLPYISYLVETGRLDAAGAAWARLLELQHPFEPRATFAYFDALIRNGRSREAQAAWKGLAERYPLAAHLPEPGNHVANGSFESPVLNGGLDWRVRAVEGAAARIDRQVFYEGTHSLRLEFDGTRNLHYAHILQYVPVEPETEYQFTGYLRARGVTTDSGVRFELVDANEPSRLRVQTEAVVGSLGWSPYSARLRTGAHTRMLRLFLTRPASRKFDSRIAGTVWADHLRLARIGPASPGREQPSANNAKNSLTSDAIHSIN
jgi:cytochrome c-type biogenesis protein CcmH/NrfG